ncbi:MAG: Hpt domain-containing protein [Betaproteobacteria bacterium]
MAAATPVTSEVPPEFDLGPLSWVQPEIDEALRRGLEALAAYTAAPEDATALKHARTHVHQAAGAIQMVGLDAVVAFTDEIERQLSDLDARPASETPAVSLCIDRACRKLQIFLDELVNGAPAVPLKLFPEYEAMQRARGARASAPTDLFYPDVSARSPAHAAGRALAADKLPSYLVRQRRQYQRGLLAWLRGDEEGARNMRDALAGIEEATAQANLRSFWWTTGALLDAIVERGLDASFGVKQLAGRIDLQIRRLVEGSAKVADRLRREVLYYVAISAPVAPSIEAVQRAFRLAGLIPSAEVLNADLVRIQPHLREAREQLGHAKESWLKFTSGRAENLPKLKQMLTSVHAHAVAIDNVPLVKLTSALVARLERMPSGNVPEPVALEYATAMLLAESAFANHASLSPEFPKQVDVMLARLDAAQAARAFEGGAGAPVLDEMSKRAQERVLLAQVGREIQANLRHMEQVLDGFFRDHGKRGELSSLAKDGVQIRGALRMLGLDAADELLGSCQEQIVSYADPATVISDADLDLLAESLSGLGFYIEAVEQQRPDHERLIVPLLARRRGETPEAITETSADSVEAAVEEQRSALPELLAEVRRAPADQAARDALKAKLAVLRDDAELIGDTELVGQARAALRELDEGGSATVAISAITGGNAALAPEVSAETQRLLDSGTHALDAELLEIFIDEAAEVLDTVAQHHRILSHNAGDREALRTVRRQFHTLKGSGRMVGLAALGEIAYEVEQVHNRLLEEDRPVTHAVLVMIGTAEVEFRRWVADLRAVGRVDPDALAVHAAILAVEAEQPGRRESILASRSPPEQRERDVGARDRAAAPFEAALESSPPAPIALPESGEGLDTEAPEEHAWIELPELGESVPDTPLTLEPVELAEASHEDLVTPIIGFDAIDVSGPGNDDLIEERADRMSRDAAESTFDAVGFAPSSHSARLSLVLPADQGPTAHEERTGETMDVAPDTQSSGPHEAGMQDPDTRAPGMQEPAQDSGAQVSGAQEPGTHELGIREPGIQDPGAHDPGTEEAGTQELGTQEPGALELGTQEPGALELGTHEPGVEDITVGGVTLSRSLHEILTAEADEHLETLAYELTLLQFDPGHELSASMVRASHTLCGIHRTGGFPLVATTARALEQCLLALQQAPGPVPSAAQPVLARAIAGLTTLAAKVKQQDAFTAPDAVEAEEIQRELDLLRHEASQASSRIETSPAASEAATEDAPIVGRATPAFFDLGWGTGERATDSVAGAEASSAFAALSPPDEPPLAAPIEVETPLDQIRDEVDAQLLPIFIEEADELFPLGAEQLRAWRRNPGDPHHAGGLRRTLHTFKGSARMAGAMRLGELTHRMETRMAAGEEVAQGTPELFDALDADLDRVGFVLDALREGRTDVVLPSLGATLAGSGAGAAAANDERGVAANAPSATHDAGASPTASPVVVRLPLPGVSGAAGDNAPSGTEPQPGAAESEAGQRAMLRVRADIIDRLVNEAGEVAIARARVEGELRALKANLLELTSNVIRMRAQVREIEIQAESQIQSRLSLRPEANADFDPLEFDRYTRFQELTRSLAEGVNDVSTVQQALLRNVDDADAALVSQARLSREVQQQLFSIRTVPFGSLSERLYRIVRQVAKDLDKRVNLDIRGTQVELDRSVLEKLVGPLEHLLRNALDHGIEARDARVAAGKAATGEIVVTVRQVGNEIAIELADDGAGLDLDRIRARAVAQGRLGANAKPTDAQLIECVFQPGFSTAAKLTSVSGRGIGMDVVRSEIATLGGRVEVSTRAGQGTTFMLYLPLTLAVAQAVLVRAGGRLWALPAPMVEQVQQIKSDPLKALYKAGEVAWQGRRYPFHYLPRLLGDTQSSPVPGRFNPVLLLRSGQGTAAMHVDEMIGHQEVVVKNIGPQLARVSGIAGATVLGTGEIVLIINPVQLAQRPDLPGLDHDAAGRALQPAAAAKLAAGPPLVMVVDDSLTVRKITSRLLTREGFEVITAKDGMDALQRMTEKTRLPDVILLDIEMPRMDGFEFTKTIKSDSRHAHIPIIMITSRTAEKHRNRAQALGVNAYLGKPYQEEELLRQLREWIAVTA